MEFTLVINPGSSSKKFALFQDTTLCLDAYIERSNEGFEMCSAVGGVQQHCSLLDKKDYKDSLKHFLNLAKLADHIKDESEIRQVAMRVVAPGTYFQKHRLVDEEYIQKLKALSSIAPLHIPHLLQEIEAINHFLPNVKICGVSDSAFHATMDGASRNYAINPEEAKRYDIYRFGYHGLSAASVMRKLSKVSDRAKGKVVICHIGSGVSVMAVDKGESIDTTMGYAPGSGLVMGTRAGDFDSGALLALMQIKNMKPQDAQVYLQTQGGLKALAGDADLRIVLERSAKGDPDSKLALASFVLHIQKAIGAAIATLGGIDCLVFTATAGERSSSLRATIAYRLAGLQIKIDSNKNDMKVSRDGVISSEGDLVEVRVVKTNESDEILRNCLEIIAKS